MTIATLVKTSCMSVVLTIFGLICQAQPHANFSASPLSGCAPFVVDFSDLSTGSPTQWKWDLGGTISFLQNPSVTYFTPGQYTIKLVVQNAAGKDSLTRIQYITVFAKPTIAFSASTLAGCFPLAVNFTDHSLPGDGSIDLWQWDFGDGTFSTSQNPSHVYNNAGTYNVSLRVRNTNSCSQTITRTQYINVIDAPHIDFSNTISNSCTPPVNIGFQNLTTGSGTITYQWNFGDAGTSSLINPSHTYTNPGSYTVQLIATNSNGCRDTLIRPNAITVGNAHTTFNSPANVCVGAAFTIANTSSPAAASVAWDFGDGTTSTATSPVKTYDAPGTYQIKLVSNFGSCADSLIKNIIVFARPTSAFTGNPLASCQAPLTVHFTNSSSNAVSNQWLFGDGAVSSQTNPSHTYTMPGNYTVTLISTNASGCSDTLVRSSYVNIELPVVNLTNLPQQGCAPFSWTFSSTAVTADPVVSYAWDFGDGGTSTLANPTHVFGPGTYSIQLIVITASGCTDTVIVNGAIKAGIQPDANFTGTPRDVCAFVPVAFTDLSTGNVTDWLWAFGDGGSSTLQSPVHTYTDTGHFPVTLIAFNNGCPDTLIIEDYVHITPPIANFTYSYNCIERLKRVFTDRSIGADTWQWDFGDGTFSSLQNPVHTYLVQGVYIVTLTVHNNITGCDHSKSSNVNVVDEHANFTVSDTVICRNNTVTFTAHVQNPGSIASYRWTFGDGTSGSNATAVHRYVLAGTYTVSLVITDGYGCKDTLTKPLYIRVNGPTAQFAPSTPGTCLLNSISFNDSSTTDGIHPIVRWIWNYGDGHIDTLSSGPFQHVYAATGVYSVTLTVMDNSVCTDRIIKSNLLTISKPVANFNTLDTTTCPNRAVTFTNSSTGPMLTYSWSFGDGGTSAAANAVHNYLADGTYSVKLVIVDRYGCTDSITKTNYITISTPRASYNLSDTLGTCPPLVVDFVNTSQNYTSILWDFGDGSFSQSAAPSHFYSVPGIYVSKLTVTGPGGCTSVMQRNIVVRGPYGTFTYSPLSGCTPLRVNFIASTTDRISFIWDFNDGNTSSTTDSVISHIYTIPGEYIPKMILRDAGGCVVPIRGDDTISVRGVTADFDFNTRPMCDSGSIQFTNHSASNDNITSYHWDFDDGSTSAQENPLHFYNVPGLYFPKLIVTTSNGCTDTLTSISPVKIVASPQASIAQTANGCTDLSVTFHGSLVVADTSALTWSWNFGNGHTSILKDPLPEIYTVAGSYPVLLLLTNSSGCMDTVRSDIEAYPIPLVSAGVDTLICQGRGININATGALTYTWTPALGLSCIDCASPLAIPPLETEYVVQGFTSYGCSNKDSVIVKVKFPFRMTHGPGDTLCIGRSAHLFASGAYSYVWSPSAGLDNTTSAATIATPQVTTVYQVTGADDRNCFTDTAFIPVIVYNIPTVEAGPDKTINVGQTIDLVPVVSPDVSEAIWSPTGSISRNNFPSITVKPRETTTYTIDVSNPGGCTARDQVTVNVLCNGANVFVPNTFSPNGDGVNEIFYPRGSGLFSIKSLRIFTRWGETVYAKSDFQANDAAAGWDGTFKGQKLNPDVYVYIMEVKCDNNSTLVYKGNIALIK